MRLFKNPNTKRKIFVAFTSLVIITLFVIFEKEKSYNRGYKVRIENASLCSIPAEDGTPTNVVPINIKDEDTYNKALEIICIEDLPDREDGKRFFKTTVRKGDGTFEIYANWVHITKWEATLLGMIKGRFEREGVTHED